MRVTLKHGLSRTPEYRAWQTMRLRCTEPTNPAWPGYGGRGITVCTEWLNDPAAFLRDLGQKPTPKHELDRVDNDRGYEPGNCRWVLRKFNCRNRRSNRLIEHGGETLPLVAWAERFGLRPDTLDGRLAAGWSMHAALTLPARARMPNGQAKATLKRACLECGATTGGTWCKPCANRRNGALANYAERAALRRAA